MFVPDRLCHTFCFLYCKVFPMAWYKPRPYRGGVLQPLPRPQAFRILPGNGYDALALAFTLVFAISAMTLGGGSLVVLPPPGIDSYLT